MPDAPRRPSSVTLTCVFVGVGCALLLVNLVSALSSWGSIPLQDAVRDALEREPARELGLTMDQALDYLRYAAWVGVVLTVSGGVFAVYAARGHRVSRVMLTVLCGLAFLVFAASGLPGLLPAAFAGVCAWSLWTPEARRWFDQVAGKDVPPLPSTTSHAHIRADPFGGTPPGSAAPSPPTAPAAGEQVARPARRRPKSVQIAVVTTIVSCVMVGLFSLLALLVSTLGADFYRTAMEQQGTTGMFQLSDAEVDRAFSVLRVVAPIWLALSVAGLVAAILTARRSRGGAVALVVTASLAIVASVPALLPFGLVSIGLAILVIVQVRRPDARAWLAGE